MPRFIKLDNYSWKGDFASPNGVIITDGLYKNFNIAQANDSQVNDQLEPTFTRNGSYDQTHDTSYATILLDGT
ncbi:MAG: hypothetical protein IPN60_19050 [Saprospiraceae bacterium]|nr:hypothetical protein [Candidatus Opimibacter skivensis]